jgi:hypothetical protein
MDILKKGLLILFSCMALLGLQACEGIDSQDDGEFEDAGETIDQGVERTGEELDEAEDEVDEEL